MAAPELFYSTDNYYSHYPTIEPSARNFPINSKLEIALAIGISTVNVAVGTDMEYWDNHPGNVSDELTETSTLSKNLYNRGWHESNSETSINLCFPKQLSLEWLNSSLESHHGKLVTNEHRNLFLEMMKPFYGMLFKDCYVSFNRFTNSINSIIVLPKGIVLNLSYLYHRKSEGLTFSLEYDHEHILAGYGKSEDIANAVTDFIANLD